MTAKGDSKTTTIQQPPESHQARLQEKSLQEETTIGQCQYVETYSLGERGGGENKQNIKR